MRKFFLVLSLLVIFSVLLAACGGSPTSGNGTPGANGTPQSSEELTGTPGGIPVTGGETQTPSLLGTSTGPSAATASPSTEGTATPSSEVSSTPSSEASSTPSSEVSSTPSAEVSSTPMATTESTQASPSGTTVPSGSIDTGLLSNLMQFQVVDQQNNVLGQVKDFVLDFTHAKVTYLIVALGQTSASTTKEVAIPWDKLQLQASSSSSSSTSSTSSSGTPEATTQLGNSAGSFVFTGDQQLLNGAPEFSVDSFPELGHAANDWDAAIQSYWSSGSGSNTTATATPSASMTETPAATATQAAGQSGNASSLQGVVLASKVVGLGVKDTSDQPLATIKDVVVDAKTGNINYLVVSINDKLIPVPPQELKIDVQNLSLIAQGGAQFFQNAPSFNLGSFPKTNNPDWDAQIQSFWNNMVQPTAKP